MQADPLAAFDAAQELYLHASLVSGFPDEGYRAADFAAHLRLKQLIDRASQVLLGEARG